MFRKDCITTPILLIAGVGLILGRLYRCGEGKKSSVYPLLAGSLERFLRVVVW
jgi:hypothetical protein